MDGIWRRRLGFAGRAGSVGGRDSFMGPPPPSATFFCSRAHNLLFCTELYAHEQRILWAPSFFLRLCADESRRRRRESGTEKISLPRRGDQHRHELPRDDGAPTQIEGIWGTTCSNFGSAFGDTSRAELKFSFRFERRRWEDAAAVVGGVINLIGS